MDRTSSQLAVRSGPPVGHTGTENLIDAVDTVDGDNAPRADGASDTSPRLRTQEPRKSFFSFLNRPESPEDTLVKLEAKRIGRYLPQLIKLEQDLGKILKELQALNKLLRAATTDGNHTALETAARKVELDLEALRSNVSNTVQNASGPQATSARSGQPQLQESLAKNWTAYDTLYLATQNRSRQIEDRYAALLREHRMCNQVRPMVIQNVDGAEDDSDSFVSFSESDT